MRISLLITLLLTACTQEKPPLSFSGNAMGTTWQVTLESPNPVITQAGITAVIEKIEALASTWRKDSYLTQLNNGQTQLPQPPEIAEMLKFAEELKIKTNGAFDIHFAGDQIDLNAIAKGYSVDRVADYLTQSKCTSFLIEIGGELRASGSKTWKVGIEQPDPASIGTITQVIPLKNQSIATSGTYRHFKGNQKNSHIIDPRTRAPIQHACPAVTVLAPTCMAADAWATALLVLGPEEGTRLAHQNNINAIFASKEP
jgi:thiamine biosynthesis lipoprotein